MSLWLLFSRLICRIVIYGKKEQRITDKLVATFKAFAVHGLSDLNSQRPLGAKQAIAIRIVASPQKNGAFTVPTFSAAMALLQLKFLQE